MVEIVFSAIDLPIGMLLVGWWVGKGVRILLSYPSTHAPERLHVLAGYSLIVLFPCLSAIAIIGNK